MKIDLKILYDKKVVLLFSIMQLFKQTSKVKLKQIFYVNYYFKNTL